MIDVFAAIFITGGFDLIFNASRWARKRSGLHNIQRT